MVKDLLAKFEGSGTTLYRLARPKKGDIVRAIDSGEIFEVVADLSRGAFREISVVNVQTGQRHHSIPVNKFQVLKGMAEALYGGRGLNRPPEALKLEIGTLDQLIAETAQEQPGNSRIRGSS